MNTLDKNAILAAKDTAAVREVVVEEWGGKVYVRVLTGAERDELEREVTGNGGKFQANFRARFAALVLCDASGAPLFTKSDAPMLGQKSANALSRVMEAGMAFNRITAEEISTALGE